MLSDIEIAKQAKMLKIGRSLLSSASQKMNMSLMVTTRLSFLSRFMLKLKMIQMVSLFLLPL